MDVVLGRIEKVEKRSKQQPWPQRLKDLKAFIDESKCTACGVCELTCFISRPEKIYTVLQGFYRDRYRKVDGRWYICRRNVEVVNPEIITKGAIGELYRELTAYLAKSSGA